MNTFLISSAILFCFSFYLVFVVLLFKEWDAFDWWESVAGRLMFVVCFLIAPIVVPIVFIGALLKCLVDWIRKG